MYRLSWRIFFEEPYCSTNEFFMLDMKKNLRRNIVLRWISVETKMPIMYSRLNYKLCASFLVLTYIGPKAVT